MAGVGLALLVATLAGGAFGQVPAISSFPVRHAVDSGVYANPTAVEQMVWQHLVHYPGAAWLQVAFKDYALPGRSRVEIAPFGGEEAQRLDRAGMAAWFPHSAYFNGEAVLVRLFAGPRTTGVHLALATVEIGTPPPGTDTICGPTDDRVPSNDKRAGRLMPVGCTGWLATTKGLVLTAGHCASRASIIEFNVPASASNGAIRHPPASDQYPLVKNLGSRASGPGCDWAVFQAGANSTHQTPIQRQGAAFKLATKPPTTSNRIRITGYGVDSGTRNQTQQTHVGPFVGLYSGTCGAYRLRYRVDTMGGNSGSPVINETTGEAVGIHTHGGCTSSGGSNSGTAITNPNLQKVIGGTTPPPTPPRPGDLILSDLSSFDNLTKLDRSTGKLSPLTSSVTPAYYNWVTMDANNTDLAASISNPSTSRPSYLARVTPGGKVTTVAITIPTGVSGTLNAIELDQDGSYVVSGSDNKLKRVTGSSVATLLTTVPTLNNCARDPDTGHFVLGIYSAGRLLEVDAAAGRVVRTIATGLGSVSSVDPEPRTGRFVVTTFSTPQVRVVSRTGSVVKSWNFSGANAVKVDDQTGHYYVAGLGTVTEFTPAGTAVKTFGPFSGYGFTAVDVYGSKQVTGAGSARPGSTYGVRFMFPDMGGAGYLAALSFAQRPGIVVGSEVLNLRPDVLFFSSLAGALVSGFTGTLDATGRAAGRISIPWFVPRGLTFFCSALAVKGATIRLANTIGITTR